MEVVEGTAQIQNWSPNPDQGPQRFAWAVPSVPLVHHATWLSPARVEFTVYAGDLNVRYETSPKVQGRPVMAQNYTQKLILALFAVLYVFPLFAHAHLIEVVAGRKECFFEDLNKGDKVTS